MIVSPYTLDDLGSLRAAQAVAFVLLILSCAAHPSKDMQNRHAAGGITDKVP